MILDELTWYSTQKTIPQNAKDIKICCPECNSKSGIELWEVGRSNSYCDNCACYHEAIICPLCNHKLDKEYSVLDISFEYHKPKSK